MKNGVAYKKEMCNQSMEAFLEGFVKKRSFASEIFRNCLMRWSKPCTEGIPHKPPKIHLEDESPFYRPKIEELSRNSNEFVF